MINEIKVSVSETFPCNLELHSYGANDPGYRWSTSAWLDINGTVENAYQWSHNRNAGARGITVASLDLNSCHILVAFCIIYLHNLHSLKIHFKLDLFSLYANITILRIKTKRIRTHNDLLHIYCFLIFSKIWCHVLWNIYIYI